MKPLPASVFAEAESGVVLQNYAYGLLIFVLLCAILYAGQPVLVPFSFALLLAILVAPVTRILERAGLPRMPSVAVTVALTFLLITSAGLLIAKSIADLAQDLPTYETNLRAKIKSLKLAAGGNHTLEGAVDVLSDLRSELVAGPDLAAATPSIKPIPVEIWDTSYGPVDAVLPLVSVLLHPVTQVAFVFLLVTFMLLQQEDLRSRFIRLTGARDLHTTTLALNDAVTGVSRLFMWQLIVNTGTGIVIGLGLALIGVPGALLWGGLTIIVRFIPYVGTLISSVFPVLIAAAVGEGWTMALLVVALVTTIEIVTGQFIEPFVFGKLTGLSPIAVIAAAAFWTALWGPIGLILSTPLTILLLVAGRYLDSVKFLEVLLGSEPALSPPELFYQRMLAGNAFEEAVNAHEKSCDNSITSYVESVAVPGLVLALRDREQGRDSNVRETKVAKTVSELLDELVDEREWSGESGSPLYVIAGHGPLNFASALLFSASLIEKDIAHTMLPDESILPQRLAPSDVADGATVVVCYLSAPGAAQAGYVARRLATALPGRRILQGAWRDDASTQSILSLSQLPATFATVAARAPGKSANTSEHSPFSGTHESVA